MRGERTPVVPASDGAVGDRIVRAGVKVALRTSLLVSPRPAALLLRKVFAAGGARTAAGLERHAPAASSVVSLIDERYGSDPDMVLDVFRPASASGVLPTVMWVHGGGFLGGSKEELSSYFKLLASHGYSVVAPRYSLAPGHRYPTPTRQMMQALEYLQGNAGRLQLDPNRVVIGGDSAGAQIAAQVGALVTTPGYADAVGVAPMITSVRLRGLVLACGQYHVQLPSDVSTPVGRQYFWSTFPTVSSAGGSRRHVVFWAYSGKRNFLEDPAFATLSVAEHSSTSTPMPGNCFSSACLRFCSCACNRQRMRR